MKLKPHERQEKKSIFRSLFVPLFLIMVLQALIFYFAAVYGGVIETLNQNAADIISERLINRKNEIETQFNNRWSKLDNCALGIDALYSKYEGIYGDKPLAANKQLQIDFLKNSADLLIDTLRYNQVNGIFLILNDQIAQSEFAQNGNEQKYGLCIRDMDQNSVYKGTEDLLLERAPSSIVDSLNCSLDSGWEGRYTFETKENGDYFYCPLNAAWENIGAKGADLAYLSGAHSISGSGQKIISYSIPLIDENGYPYAVVGIEVYVNYLASLMPNEELNDPDKCCYILAIEDTISSDIYPIIGDGSLYNRCFGSDQTISLGSENSTGGFSTYGRGNVLLYGSKTYFDVYNNNNPFENRILTLIAIVEDATLFVYSEKVKTTLFIVALLSLVLGITGIIFVSRRFASPITALATRVRGMEAQNLSQLERLGISEIDQLVDSIDELNKKVNRNSARTEFFSRMSHDMRTPMNAIIGFSSPEFLDGATEGEKDDYLAKIHTSGEFLLTLINDVLDMTKIESNKTDLSYETINAETLFQAILPIIDKLAVQKGVDFSNEISVGSDIFIQTDVQHLNQAIMNLLSNAVKFTDAGGKVALAVKLDNSDENNNLMNCSITVKDTGIGMSKEFMKNLYTPFEQENTRQEGTGLGLSIAKKIVELMNGSIECESEKGVGTCFTINLPMKKSTDTVPDELILQKEAVNSVSLIGKRVLICEDNTINMQIIRHLLEKSGILTEAVFDGAEGVKAFENSSTNYYDAILMDIRMPILDGIGATKKIRALKKEDANTIPIIAMTANAFDEDVRACEEAGMNAHLAKPLEPKKL